MRHGILNRDTSIDIERRQIEAWRAMSSVEKLDAVRAATRAALQLAMAGIRLRHPDANDEECRLRLARLTLGPELAARVHPESSRLSGY